MAYDMAEERYIGTTGRGVEKDTLPTCGNRTTKDNAKIPIAESSGLKHDSPILRTLEKKTQTQFAPSEGRRPPTIIQAQQWARKPVRRLHA